MGLLFHNNNGYSEEELHTLVAHEDVRTLLGPVYFGTILQWNTPRFRYRNKYFLPSIIDTIPSATSHYEEAYYIAPQLWFSPTVMHPVTPVLFRVHDHVGRFNTFEAFNRCMEMQKFVDCRRCPNIGINCLLVNAPDPLPQQNIGDSFQLCLSQITAIQRAELFYAHADTRWLPVVDDWINRKFKNWHSKFAGYTIIPSIATESVAVRPGTQAARYPYAHVFYRMDLVRFQLSERTQQGVRTRKTRRTQCSKCHLGGKIKTHINTCVGHGPRICQHGAWTEEELIETTLAEMENRLKQAGYDLETVWRVGLIAGHIIKRERQKWMVSRVYNYTGHAICINLARVAYKHRGETQSIQSFATIYKTLPDVLKRQLDAHQQIDRRLLALALHASAPREGQGYHLRNCFWYYRPQISYVRIEPNNGVRLGLWGRTFERNVLFRSFKDLIDYFGALPLFSPFVKNTAMQ